MKNFLHNLSGFRLEEILKILDYIGLEKKETYTYLALLVSNQSTPGLISNITGIKRPTVYTILDRLKNRGLVSSIKKGNVTYFRALDPSLLLEDQYNKYLSLKKIIPDLNSLNDKYSVRPQISLYEGKDGLISIMEDTLKTSTTLLCWGDVPNAVDTILSDYYPIYIAKKVKNNVKLRGIVSYSRRALEFKKRGKEELREFHFVPANFSGISLTNEINIYDNKIAIISHRDQIGVIIENESIANSQRFIFNFAFEQAKIIEKSLLTPEDIQYLGDALDYTIE